MTPLAQVFGPKKILVVDDDPFNIRVMVRFVEKLGHIPLSCRDPETALTMVDDSLDLVVVDVMMPGMDGFTFVRRLRERQELNDLPVLMATTLDDRDSRLEAVQAGANDYLCKPIDQTEFNIRVSGLLRLKSSRDEVRNHMALLGKMVEDRTADLRLALDRLRKSSREVVLRLSTAAEFKDDDTAAHIQRMSLYASLLAKRAGLEPEDVQLIQEVSPMHDIGKIGIPDAILLKPGKLNPDEWQVMQRHVEFGAKILGESDSQLIQAARTIVLSHHERWDGSGYPAGLAGEAIPLFGRICAVADVFDALTSRRPYKEAFSLEKSLSIMAEGRGTHFDPRLLDLFIADLDSVKAIMLDHPD